MSGPAKSVLAHGIYLALSGATLITVPNLLFGLPDLLGAIWTALALRSFAQKG